MASRKTKEQRGKKILIQSTLTQEGKRPTCLLDPGAVVMPSPKSQRGRSSGESEAPALSLQGAEENGAGARRKTTRIATESTRMREMTRLQESQRALQREANRRRDTPQALLEAGEQDTSFESDGKDKDIQLTSEAESEDFDIYPKDPSSEQWPRIEGKQEQILQVISRFELNMQQEFKKVRQEIRRLDINMSKMEGRVQKVEEEVQNNYDEFTEYKGRVDKVEDSFTGWELQRNQLMQKIDQLENQSRRNNVKILGIPEGTETLEVTLFFQNWLKTIFDFDNTVELERAHRIGRRNQVDRRPRPVLVRCLRYQDRERILRAAIQNARDNGAPMTMGGNKVLFYPDLSSEVVKSRKEFNPAKALLWQKGYKFSFKYPAALKIQDNGNDFLLFMDPQQAFKHAQNLPTKHRHPEASNLQQDQGDQQIQASTSGSLLKEERIQIQIGEEQKDLIIGLDT